VRHFSSESKDEAKADADKATEQPDTTPGKESGGDAAAASDTQSASSEPPITPLNAVSGENGVEPAKEAATAAADGDKDVVEKARGRVSERKGMKPSEMVQYLDQYIIGQKDAKRAVANALRNRWRRQQLKDSEMKDDIMPKNILMIGPTGCGKTEIARRLSKLVDAPFIKVEATKFTEVGFHGRDVDQILRDLVELAIKRQRQRLEEELKPQAEEAAEKKILEALLGKIGNSDRQSWLDHLRNGHLDDQMIQVEVPISPPNSFPMGGSGSGMPQAVGFGVDVSDIIQDYITQRQGNIKAIKVVTPTGGGSSKKPTEKKQMAIKEAKTKLVQIELDKMINQDMVLQKAIEAVEQEGIVFIDEIDKICTKSGGYRGPDASSEGVQRDLLPLIEGSSIPTRYGSVKTDYILFIASGAFHSVKPSDMLAELQGRLPVRVELKPLTEEDFVKILKESRNNLIDQNKALLETEGVEVVFDETAVQEIAKVAAEVNTSVENIGARRLHTIIEKIMEEFSYNAPEMESGKKVSITADVVRTAVGELLKKTDLHKFIL